MILYYRCILLKRNSFLYISYRCYFCHVLFIYYNLWSSLFCYLWLWVWVLLRCKGCHVGTCYRSICDPSQSFDQLNFHLDLDLQCFVSNFCSLFQHFPIHTGACKFQKCFAETLGHHVEHPLLFVSYHKRDFKLRKEERLLPLPRG